MDRLTLFHTLQRAAALACLVLTAGCADSPTAPPPVDPGAPVLTCPAAVTQLSSLGIPLPILFNLPTVAGGFAPVVGPVCSPSSGSVFGQGAKTVTCTATDARGRTGGCTFNVTVTYPPKLSGTRFIAFGDSMTWGEDGQFAATTTGIGRSLWHTLVRFPFADTYPGALQIDLVGRYTLQSPSVYNDGSPGEALVGALPRFTNDLAAGKTQYDAVLIMEGSNDLDNRDATVEPAMIATLGGMIDYARRVGVTPFLATVPPMNPAGCCPYDRGLGFALVAGFDEQVRALATSKNVPLADVYAAFNGDLTLIGPDDLHPTAAGYHLIAQTFFTAIEQNLEIKPTATAATRPLSSLRRFR